MKNLTLLNIYLVALMGLFLLLPIGPAKSYFTAKPKPQPKANKHAVGTPSVILKEEGLTTLAKFKAYDENINGDSFTIIAKKTEEPEKTETTPEVTPAVQSIALSIENVSQTPEVTPQPEAIDLTSSPKSLTEEQILFLGNCEAGMDPAKNTGNGYYGAFQFSYGTWQSMNTDYERADLAPIEVQIDAVQRLLQRSSIFTQFPACAQKMASQGMI